MHTFGSNGFFEVDFKINSYNDLTNGLVSFIVRSNSAEDRVVAVYQFSDRKWYLKERNGAYKQSGDKVSVPNPSVTKGVSAAINYSGWNRVRLESNGSTVSLYVNGTPLLSANSFEHLNYGRVGMEVRYADVYFDNVVFRGDGEGRVHDGVKEVGGMR